MITAKVIRKPKYTYIPSARWKYVSSTVAAFDIVGVSIRNCNISHNGRKLGYVDGNRVYILSAYAWDGMSGYPDSKDNMLDGLLHDFFYQTALISRKDADLILKNMSARHDPFYLIIYGAVRAFGWRFYGKDKGIKIDTVL